MSKPNTIGLGEYTTRDLIAELQNRGVVTELLQEMNKQVKASKDNLAYAKKNKQSDRTIASWKGCLEGEKFIIDAVINFINRKVGN